ncbi:MAG: hypothetical protein HUJ51_05785 [Eggerthellaceae bacterium]|nr:hypothetical protein [Eggerthellaceae bacterium]
MKSKKKIEFYRRLLVLTGILLSIFVILFTLSSIFAGNSKEDFAQREQSAKPSYELKAEKSQDSTLSEAEKNKNYALQENNKGNLAQSSDNSFIYDISIADLSNNGTQFDGQCVQTSGEVIGNLIEFDDCPELAWICLRSTQGTDDTISVIVDRQDAEQIDTYGKYDVRGTIVQVLGSFHLICKGYEGECDLYCQTFKIIEKGYVCGETFNIFTFLLSSICCVITIVVFLFYKIKNESVK